MRRFILALVLVAASNIALATPLSEQEKKDFVRVSVTSCLAKQREDRMSKYTSDSQKNEYCYCYGKKVAELVSIEDVGRVFQTKSIESMRPSIDAATTYCVQRLTKEWGFAK